jgi:hypothetical protein
MNPEREVTLRRKCYTKRSKPRYSSTRVFRCIYCDRLADSSRSHAITCSTACRVALHRNPEALERLERIADDLPVGMLLEIGAVMELRPDLGEQIESGTLKVYEARPEVYRAFIKLLFASVREPGVQL